MEKLADKVGRGIRYDQPRDVERIGAIEVKKGVDLGLDGSRVVRVHEGEASRRSQL
jgi:hypothetical protein